MFENTDLEEFSHVVFEDEADMLEFCYEKIENSVYIWTLWCKAFAPDLPEEDARGIVTEFLTEIHRDMSKRVTAAINFAEAGNVLEGFIKKYRDPHKICDTDTRG